MNSTPDVEQTCSIVGNLPIDLAMVARADRNIAPSVYAAGPTKRRDAPNATRGANQPLVGIAFGRFCQLPYSAWHRREIPKPTEKTSNNSNRYMVNHA